MEPISEDIIKGEVDKVDITLEFDTQDIADKNKTKTLEINEVKGKVKQFV